MTAHLNKVLQHAERKLAKVEHAEHGKMLDAYRDFIRIEEHRLFLAHKAGESGWDHVRRRSELINIVLKKIWHTALSKWREENKNATWDENALSLLAVGGFGRGELCPFSDIDLLFLRKTLFKDKSEQQAIENIVERILYILWDIGFKVGHATRTLDNVAQEANANFQTKTALLETHLIDGSEKLYKEFQTFFYKNCIQEKEQEYLEWRDLDQNERWKKFGNTVFVQEPHLKNGCGGLRDYHNLIWIAKITQKTSNSPDLLNYQWLLKDQYKRIQRAYDFLLRIRNELHYQQKRLGDILTLQLQGQVANAFHYPQKNILKRTENFMRDYYQAARDIFQITNLSARRMWNASRKKRKTLFNLKSIHLTKKNLDGFKIVGKELHTLSEKTFKEDATRLVKVFRLMQQHNTTLHADLENLIRQQFSLLNRKMLWTPEVRETFFSILRKKGQVGRILRKMHDTSILGQLIPEFEPLTCLVQHEFFHAYTADEHTLVCTEQLDRVLDCADLPYSRYREIFLQCEHPDILYLALILHDTGKAMETRNHHEASAQLAMRFAKRMKIQSKRLRDLIFLVDHHSTLSQFAQRRNLDDIETIREFARIVENRERLDMLMLMTFADAQGVSGKYNNWSSWKELLVWNLYNHTREMLQGEEEFVKHNQVNREATIARIKKMIGSDISSGECLAHFAALPDRYLLHTSDDLMVEHIKLVNEFLTWQAEHLDESLRPCIRWIQRENEGHSEVIVVTWDREALFSKIAGAFALAGLNILSADIFTRRDNIVVDTFRVCNSRFIAVTNKVEHQMFEKNLTKSLALENFDILSELAKQRAQYPTSEEGFPTRISLDNDASSEYTLLHIETPDHLGLLHEITTCLALNQITIFHSRITTEKGAALDTFYIAKNECGKIMDDASQTRLLKELQEIITHKQ